MRTWRGYDLVFFDCDSTLTRIEGIDELARLKWRFDITLEAPKPPEAPG